MPELGGPGGPWPPQYLADQLALFEPGSADYPHLLLLAPPMFFTFRHHCYLFIQFINSFLLHDYENRKTNKYIIVSGKLNLAYLIPNLHSAFNDSFYSISIL